MRATIEKELGLENWDWKIEIVKTDGDVKIVLNNSTKTSTDSNLAPNKGNVTPAPSSTTTKTTTTSSVPTKLSEADILMLKRMSRNVEID